MLGRLPRWQRFQRRRTAGIACSSRQSEWQIRLRTSSLGGVLAPPRFSIARANIDVLLWASVAVRPHVLGRPDGSGLQWAAQRRCLEFSIKSGRSVMTLFARPRAGAARRPRAPHRRCERARARRPTALHCRMHVAMSRPSLTPSPTCPFPVMSPMTPCGKASPCVAPSMTRHCRYPSPCAQHASSPEAPPESTLPHLGGGPHAAGAIVAASGGGRAASTAFADHCRRLMEEQQQEQQPSARKERPRTAQGSRPQLRRGWGVMLCVWWSDSAASIERVAEGGGERRRSTPAVNSSQLCCNTGFVYPHTPASNICCGAGKTSNV